VRRLGSGTNDEHKKGPYIHRLNAARRTYSVPHGISSSLPHLSSFCSAHARLSLLRSCCTYQLYFRLLNNNGISIRFEEHTDYPTTDGTCIRDYIGVRILCSTARSLTCGRAVTIEDPRPLHRCHRSCQRPRQFLSSFPSSVRFLFGMLKGSLGSGYCICSCYATMNLAEL
jgi:hypothetical protein